MGGYREFRFYDPTLDVDAVRLSLCDDRGQEYYAIVQVTESGKSWRARREAALNAIDDAIVAGDPPGAVHVEQDTYR